MGYVFYVLLYVYAFLCFGGRSMDMEMACYVYLLGHCKLHLMEVHMAAPLRMGRRVLTGVLVYTLPLTYPFAAVM